MPSPTRVITSSAPFPFPNCSRYPLPVGIRARHQSLQRTNMDTVVTGKAYVLGDNIDTDQIIPAQYLSFNPSLPEERKFFGMYALSSVPEGQRGLRGAGDDTGGSIPFVRENEFKSDYTIIIGGKNFCARSPPATPPP